MPSDRAETWAEGEGRADVEAELQVVEPVVEAEVQVVEVQMMLRAAEGEAEAEVVQVLMLLSGKVMMVLAEALVSATVSLRHAQRSA